MLKEIKKNIKIDAVIPILNEEESLHQCLTSIVSFNVPENVSMRINIVDGGSEDRSLKIAKEFMEDHQNIFILNNPKKIQSAAMNMVINSSDSDYILRLDAGNIYSKDYLINCLETSIRRDADNVGGLITTIAASGSFSSSIVESIMSHPFGVGNSTFRTGSSEEKKVDTVPFGFFKKSVFKKVGLFNENLLRAQDYELNSRIVNAGGEIWLNPKIKGDYLALPLMKFLGKLFFLEGPYNAYMWYLSPESFSIRHSITLFFCIGIIGGIILSPLNAFIKLVYFGVLALYLILAVISSIQVSIQKRDLRFFICMPIIFFLYHFIHGFGVLLGVVRIITRTSPVQRS